MFIVNNNTNNDNNNNRTTNSSETNTYKTNNTGCRPPSGRLERAVPEREKQREREREREILTLEHLGGDHNSLYDYYELTCYLYVYFIVTDIHLFRLSAGY